MYEQPTIVMRGTGCPEGGVPLQRGGGSDENTFSLREPLLVDLALLKLPGAPELTFTLQACSLSEITWQVAARSCEVYVDFPLETPIATVSCVEKHTSVFEGSYDVLGQGHHDATCLRLKFFGRVPKTQLNLTSVTMRVRGGEPTPSVVTAGGAEATEPPRQPQEAPTTVPPGMQHLQPMLTMFHATMNGLETRLMGSINQLDSRMTVLESRVAALEGDHRSAEKNEED